MEINGWAPNRSQKNAERLAIYTEKTWAPNKEKWASMVLGMENLLVTLLEVNTSQYSPNPTFSSQACSYTQQECYTCKKLASRGHTAIRLHVPAFRTLQLPCSASINITLATNLLLNSQKLLPTHMKQPAVIVTSTLAGDARNTQLHSMWSNLTWHRLETVYSVQAGVHEEGCAIWSFASLCLYTGLHWLQG